ncbi:MAG: MscL family protein, partial [Acutalibacteraceae bacterium]|nr:MscL family protein [Acutalibacteraceae bacterium]
LVNDVIMPAVGSLLGKVDLSELNIVLREAVMEGDTVVTPAVQIGIGTFLVTVIDFLIIAFVVFIIVKLFGKAKEIADAKLKKATEEEAEVIEEKKPTTEELLTQILAEIKKD